MNKNQEKLIYFLQTAIHGKKISNTKYKYIEWEQIYKESVLHQVHTLIYPVINRIVDSEKPNSNLMFEWQKNVLMDGIRQTQHIQQVRTIFKKFNNRKIPVIALKGLVIREIYPYPELRTMSDADILVHKEDLEKAKDILLQMGYINDSTIEKHMHFSHPDNLSVELHWTLSDEKYISDISSYEKDIWKNAISAGFEDIDVMMLSLEDLAVHLCLHMAVHIKCSGFGLRQLCDFVLLVEEKGDQIDWSDFYIKIKSIGIRAFTNAIFYVCKDLFSLKIPNSIVSEIKETKYKKLLINEIFSSGVFGKKSLIRMYSTDLVANAEKVGNRHMFGKIKYLISIVFPSNEKLSDKYAYAKKSILLLPIAWIHHLINGIKNDKLTIYEKLVFFILTIRNSKKRSRLLRGLEL